LELGFKLLDALLPHINSQLAQKGLGLIESAPDQPTIETTDDETARIGRCLPCTNWKPRMPATSVSRNAFAMLVDQQWLWKEDHALARRLQSARLKERGVIEDIDYQHPVGARPQAAADFHRQ
jgi:hypothetical protein